MAWLGAETCLRLSQGTRRYRFNGFAIDGEIQQKLGIDSKPTVPRMPAKFPLHMSEEHLTPEN